MTVSSWKAFSAIAIVLGIVFGFCVITWWDRSDKDLGALLIGIAASLFAWWLVTFLSKAIDNSFAKHDETTTRIADAITGQHDSLNTINNSFGEHDATTTRILNVVTGQHLSLKDYRRNPNELSKELARYWPTARDVKISGRALQGFTAEFFSHASHPLRDRIKRGKDVRVRLLLLDPNCDAVTHLECREPGSKTDIERVLRQIRDFQPSTKDSGPRNGNSVEVRITAEPLNTTLTAVLGSAEGESILLMGMLYNGIPGNRSELFQVPNYVPQGMIAAETLHSHCLANFDNTFEKAEKVFRWTASGVEPPPNNGQSV